MDDDRRARFEDLHDRHARAVLAYLLRRADPDTADDVLAETLLVAWRRLDEVPVDAAPWLIAVARRQLANARRGDRRRRALRDRLAREPVPAVEPVATDPAVAAALWRLPDRDREVLALTAWDGLDPGGLAVALGCTRATARVRLHRARRRFAAALDAERRAPGTCPSPATGSGGLP